MLLSLFTLQSVCVSLGYRYFSMTAEFLPFLIYELDNHKQIYLTSRLKVRVAEILK